MPGFRPHLLRPLPTFLLVLLALALVAAPTTRAADDEMDRLEVSPLATRSQAAGTTMFTRLAPGETGIVTENAYADPQMWSERQLEFSIGEIGTGVAIGDYDGDGRPDVFVVSKTESCRLFRNLGGWKFADVTTAAGVADRDRDAMIWKQGAAFADVNNDGHLDLYVCRFDAPNLLYLNQGDGTFREGARAAGLDLRDASVMGAFCDYDRDGWLDVLVQTNLLDANARREGQRDRLFRNNRDGTFTDVTDRAGISGATQGHSATWWDYDHDGWPDLYLANDFAAPDQLYRNQRDGTFVNVIDHVVPHTPFSSMGADLGDIDNDGWMDLFVPDMAATSHEKDQRGMAESRDRTHEDPRFPRRAPQYEYNAVYLNTGAGYCREAAFLTGLAATDWSWSPRLEDLDNDGRLDLFVTTGMHREATNVDLLVRQLTTEVPAERLRVMRDSPVMAEPNLAFRNEGDLRFTRIDAAWGLDESAVSFGSALGDLDGDGDLDIVYGNYQQGATVLRNDAGSGHRVMIALRGTASNRFGIGATLRLETAWGAQLRQLVVARGILSSSEPVAHFGLGPETNIRRLTVSWPSGHIQTFTNLAGDHHYTIREPAAPVPTDLAQPATDDSSHAFVEVSEVTGLVLASQEEEVDEVALQPLLPMRHHRRGPAVAVGDLNGDGRDDLVVGGTTLTPTQCLMAAGPGRFAVTPVNFSTARTVDDGPLLIFDANADGANDVLITKGGSSLPAGLPDLQPELWLGDGRGGFQPAERTSLPRYSASVGAVVAADFDRSGRLGLFVGGRVSPGEFPVAPRSMLLANRGGRFEDVTAVVAPQLRDIGMVSAALWSDVDQDGWIDLLVALDWGGIRLFHNVAGRRFEDWSERAGFAPAGTGWWTSLAAADFNGDGRIDYVAGNAGLNTRYHASPAHPALLFHGDFKGDGGQPQLIEAYYEGDRLLPRRGRRLLGTAIPAILRRFPRNDAFARATLDEILGAEKLAAADRLVVTELRSGVFLSSAGGTFHFVPLPRIAQIAPLQGMVAGDFDGDGHADIYAVQNSHRPVPAVGRFDGGVSQLLRGDGRGGFAAVPPASSRLIVPGDAKALVALALDDDAWTDFFVSRNNSTTLAFRNPGNAGRNMFRVTLRGPAGNPSAAGARVTIVHRDGSTQTSETTAGGGYYGQSTAALGFGFPDDNPPQSIRVSWPSGRATTLDYPPDAKALTISEDPAQSDAR